MIVAARTTPVPSDTSSAAMPLAYSATTAYSASVQLKAIPDPSTTAVSVMRKLSLKGIPRHFPSSRARMSVPPVVPFARKTSPIPTPISTPPNSAFSTESLVSSRGR